jgi:hypothetical protein
MSLDRKIQKNYPYERSDIEGMAHVQYKLAGDAKFLLVLIVILKRYKHTYLRDKGVNGKMILTSILGMLCEVS